MSAPPPPPKAELLPDWLLAACVHSLETGDVFYHRPSDPATDPYHPLRLAFTQLRPSTYPPRPLPSTSNTLEASGKASAALVQVLKEAPDRHGPGGNATPGIVESFYAEDGDYSYDWSGAYRKRVERALGDIALSEGEEVYTLARWTVYDTVSLVSHLMLATYRYDCSRDRNRN